MSEKEAKYLEYKYFNLTAFKNGIGKIKTVTTTIHDIDENYFKVVVVFFTNDSLNDMFYDLDDFCNIAGINYSEE
ncbi:MAG: hypothetical protein ABJA37_09725, partial [Ferruginibacter sp.]